MFSALEQDGIQTTKQTVRSFPKMATVVFSKALLIQE